MYAPEPVEESDTKEDHVKHECPKCKGEGCEHCDGKGYHVEDEDEDPVGKNEEVEIEEHCGECEMGIEEEVSEKDYDSLKKGDTITIEYKGAMSSGKSSFKVTAKNIVGKAKVGKVTLQSTKNPKGVKHFLYKRGNKVSFAQGDMAASVVKYTKEEVELDEMPNRANMEKINSLLKKYAGKFKWRDEELYVEKGIEKDVANRIKISGLNMPTIKISSNPMREEDEIDEKKAATGYELYHKDFSSAMQHAYAHAKKKGVIVDPKEIDDKVATGPKKPSSGKTNRYILGTNTKKNVHIQVANLDNKRFELNMYIEGAIKESALDKVRGMIKERSVTQDKFFPKVLMDGIRKVIPGVKLVRHTLKHPRSKETIPGLGLQLSGDKGIRVMIQYDKEDSPAPKGLDKTIVDIDPETGKKEVTDTSLRDGYVVWVNEVGKVWSKGEVKWVQSKEFRDPKKVVQFLKTKVKRMAKEEVEIDESKALQIIMALDDAGIKSKKVKGSQQVSVAKKDYKKAQNILRPEAGLRPLLKAEEVVVEREMTDAEKDKREEIVLSLKKKTKDFKERYGDKWKEVMYATATKMAMGEEKDKKESSSKKDKINLKPTMDETMKKYKDLLKGLKEKKSTTEDTDKDTPGTQGDNAEWQKKRSAVLKKFGVKSCAALGTEEEKKACYKALDDAHVADHEEEVKKEQVEVDARKKGYKEAIKRIEARRTKVSEKEIPVKEAVTLGGVEYGEQDFDHGARLDHAAPNLDINMRMAEFTEQGLEGPYLFKGETYFFDRKVNGWYSLSSEDYVDDATNAELGYHYTRDGGYKKQFSS
jgi:hypothetical protein